MALTLGTTLSYYKRRDIQEEMVRQAKDKEVGARFDDSFGKRPDVLTYPADILELAKNKMTSMHCSEESWVNPMLIRTGMKKQELDEIRKGWDLVLDIDCKFFEYSRIAAFHTINALKANGVKSVSVKFSGNKGFHVAVPFEAFPSAVGGKKMADLFPDAPRRIATYITDMIRKPLADDILKMENGSFRQIIAKTGLSAEEITRHEKNEFGDRIPKLNVEPFLEIDTILISSRHMFRMPYSLHEKSGLVSVPCDVDNVMAFEKKDADPLTVQLKYPFLDRNVKFADAEQLLRNAFDYAPVVENVGVETKKKYDAEQKKFELPEKAIGEEAFPPCVKLMLSGMQDGKKRAVFAMIKFLAGCGWEYDQIEERLVAWNKINPEPLREQVLVGQIRYAKQINDRTMPPPSCNNANYYKGIGVCRPDELCARIRNPLQYAKLKARILEGSAGAVKKTRKKEEPTGEVEFN